MIAEQSVIQNVELNADEETEFTSRKISPDKSDPSIETLEGRERRNKLNLQPDFQRYFVWDIKKASRLIESVLLGVPLPTVYLSEEKNGVSCVIDGQQRLTSLFSFYRGQFPNGDKFMLKGLNVLRDLEGKTFKDLDDELQENFLNYSLRVITFPKESDENLKFEIFERLNMGSAQLNDQELRNCIYRGNLNNLIKELAQYSEFRDIMGFAQEPKLRMEDCEFVLRFCALYYLGADKYKPSMKSFMNQMAEKGKTLPEKELNELADAFKRACQMTKSIFADHAFKRYYGSENANESGRWESKQFNASLYDVIMVTFAQHSKNVLMRHADAIRESFIDLMANDVDFNQAITVSTSSAKNVKLRFAKWQNVLLNIMQDDTNEPRTFSLSLKKSLWEQNPTCAICHNTIHSLDDAAIDHIEQYWCGGKTIPENARLAHRFCNNSRARKE